MNAAASARSDVSPRTARRILWTIVLAAFALRVVYVLQARASPLFMEPQMDALYHVEWARAFARGEDYQPGPFFRAPLYPWFLGLVFRLFGDGLLGPRLVQAAIGAGSCALTYAVGARAFDRRTGLLGAALVATYWTIVYFDGELLLPVLEVPTCLGAILLALCFGERPTLARAALAGAAVGLAAIVRPNALVLLVCVVPWIVWIERARWRSALLSCAAYLAGAALPIVPITAHNVLVGQDRVLISSQGGVNLWIGNNPSSDGSSAIVPGTRQDWWGGYHDAIRQAEIAEGRTLKPSEVSRHYTRRALEFWRDKPRAALALLWTKIRLFTIDWELGNNQDERFFALRYGPILRALPVGFALVAPLALLGLLASARRARAIFPLWIFVPAYSAGVVAFFVCARFRVPVLAPLAIFAAHGMWTFVDLVGARRFARAASALALVIAGFAATRAYPRGVDTSDASGLWQLGVLAAASGDRDAAVEAFRSAIDANERKLYPRRDLAIVLTQLGRFDEAEQSLRAALAIDPRDLASHRGGIELAFARGDLETALARAKDTLEIRPTSSLAHFDLGRAHFARAGAARARGDLSATRAEALAAAAAFERAHELAANADEAFDADYSAGETLVQIGDFGAALARFERAVRARPEPDAAGWFWRAQRGRCTALVGLGRSAQASALADDFLRAHPLDPAARQALEAFR